MGAAMIPIGTRCVIVPDGKPSGPRREYIGKQCVVAGYEVPPSERQRGDDVMILVDGFAPLRSARSTCLIPIGHDPDAETRKVEREVEA